MLNKKNILNIIIALVIFLIGYIIIGNVAARSEELFTLVRYNNFIVLTGSMEPEISPGDFITIRKVNPDKLKVNDIITYRINDEAITHRIIKIEGDKITTKGDANNTEDPEILKTDVVGKYAFKIPKLGYVINYLALPASIVFIVGLIGILIFLDITGSNKEKNKSKGKYISNEEYNELKKYNKHARMAKCNYQTPLTEEAKNHNKNAKKHSN